MAGGIFEAYLAGAAGAFFPSHFGAPADRRRAVAQAARPLAAVVADALEAQNAALAPSPARAAHLAALRRGAAAVVTGQQVGLFLGPLFTVFKAASAIRLARRLAEESGTPVVPIFWLQSEDHDLPEIATCHVPGANGTARVVSIPTAPGERVSIAHRTLPGEIEVCLAALGDELAHLPHAAVHLVRLAGRYRAGTGWTAAFAGVLGELFAAEGLVLLDPRDPALAAAAAPVHRRALLEAEAIAAALVERGRGLAAAGFPPPVHVRPGAPLSFFHPDGAEGPRYRLAPDAGGYALVGGERRYAREQLLAALEATPRQFSTSALLRPILQDTLLSTAAYVGGPGEVAYFAQLAPLYAAYDLPMPLIVPRVRMRVVEEKAARLLARLGLTVDDAQRPEAELIAATTPAAPAAADEVSCRLLAPFAAAADALRDEIEPLGEGVRGALAKTRRTVETAVAKLAAKVELARRHQDQDAIAAVRRVKQMLFPSDTPQERVYGLAYFAARYGERPFLERVLDAADPLDPAPRTLAFAERAEVPA